MGPDTLSYVLKQLADDIELRKAPKGHVLASLKSVLAALPYKKKPIPAKPIPKVEDPLADVKSQYDDKGKRLPVKRGPKSDLWGGAGEGHETPEHEEKLKKLSDKVKSDLLDKNPEMESYESFVSFLDEEDRDAITPDELDIFYKIHKISPTTTNEVLADFGKYPIVAFPKDPNIYAPDEIINKVAKELKVSPDDIRKFLRGLKYPMVDSKEIMEAYV